MKKIIPVLLSCCFVSMLFCSCDKEETSNINSQTTDSQVTTAENQQSSSSETSDPAATLDTDIDPDRLNTDYSSLEKKASALFDKYYDGIKNGDYKTFSQVFPDFYLEALEEEGKEYNQTNEEFIKSINETNKTTYGDDYYSFAEITAILQLTDESLETLKNSINESFSEKVELEDAYSVYINQNTRGSLNRDSQEYDYFMLTINGENYLYDEYFAK